MATTRTKSPSKTKAAASPTPSGDDEAVGFEAALERLRPTAEVLDPAHVVPLRADLALALHNAQRGTVAVKERPGEAKSLPGIDLAQLLALPEVIGAALVAEQRIDRGTKQSDLPELLTKGRVPCAQLLAAVDALAMAEIVSVKEVERIRKGRGALEAASDFVPPLRARIVAKQTKPTATPEPAS